MLAGMSGSCYLSRKVALRHIVKILEDMQPNLEVKSTEYFKIREIFDVPNRGDSTWGGSIFKDTIAHADRIVEGAKTGENIERAEDFRHYRAYAARYVWVQCQSSSTHRHILVNPTGLNLPQEVFDFATAAHDPNFGPSNPAMEIFPAVLHTCFLSREIAFDHMRRAFGDMRIDLTGSIDRGWFLGSTIFIKLVWRRWSRKLYVSSMLRGNGRRFSQHHTVGGIGRMRFWWRLLLIWRILHRCWALRRGVCDQHLVSPYQHTPGIGSSRLALLLSGGVWSHPIWLHHRSRRGRSSMATLTTFHFFPLLPIELRTMIYCFACDDSVRKSWGPSVVDCFWSMPGKHYSPLWTLCIESRNLMLHKSLKMNVEKLRMLKRSAVWGDWSSEEKVARRIMWESAW